jgi:hypothetical protein
MTGFTIICEIFITPSWTFERNSRICLEIGGIPRTSLITKITAAARINMIIREKNNTGRTRRTVDISAKRERFPGLVFITIQTHIRRIIIKAISAGKIICQKLEPAGDPFFSVMITIL